MDKYEYKLKMDQIKSLIEEKDYEAAADLADQINWKKVKNSNTLMRIGLLYEKLDRYDDSMELLLMAYDRSPIGRMIVYHLACVSVKAGSYDEALEYYDEFVEIAPQDPLKYIIKYKISKAKGDPISEQIAVLEQLKEQEYDEEWAYELAYLYHKAGRSENCIDACDELILWFGEGKYVEKALELKMLYQPLNKHQEEKYRQMKQRRKGIVEVRPNDVLESGEIVHEAVEIPPVTMNTSRFNTVNLQAELAKSMQQIMNATEKETVSDTLDNIKKMVEEIPYLQLSREEEQTEEERYPHIETDEEIDGSLKIDFQEILAEDMDGQLSLNMPEASHREPQITGQMSIEDVLDEWERTKRAAEAAMENAKQRKLESAKARALQETGSLMELLADVIPQAEGGEMSELSVADDSQIPEEEVVIAQGISDILNNDPMSDSVTENEPVQTDAFASQEAAAEIGAEPVEDMDLSVDEKLREAVSGALEEEIGNLSQVTAGIDELLKQPENKLPDATVELPSLDAFIIKEARKAQEKEREEAEALAKAVAAAGINAAENASGAPVIEEPEKLPEVAEPEEEFDEMEQTELTAEQKETFSYFVPVGGMEKQICQVLVGASKRMGTATSSASGNIIIQGYPGSGKTQLASNLLKALQQKTGKMLGKPGRIYADALNQKDVAAILKKVEGGCLIIEKAGDLSRETATRLSLLMEGDTKGMLVILEDTRVGIEQALRLDSSFAKKFTEKINIPIFTSDELIAFAKTYAKDEECEIDEMGILALYNRISNIQRVDMATTLSEVKNIVDEAIDNARNGGWKRAIGSVFTKRRENGGYLVLVEKDFEV